MMNVKLMGEAQVVTADHIATANECLNAGMTPIATIKELRAKYGFGLRDAKVVLDTTLDQREPGYIERKNKMIEDIVEEFDKDEKGL